MSSMNEIHSQHQAGIHQLLRTKLAPPRLNGPLVSRLPLLARLDEGMAYKLTLISAPPGFGKTTLVSEWGATRDDPIAWVSLDAGDNDPVRFWRYVITACRAFDATLGKSALAALRASQQPSFEAILTSFINELAELPDRYVLVLDDYHLITSREIHAALTFLLDYFPPALHLILTTRSEPPLPLARLRVHNELNQLDTTDLRFSLEEIRTFFQETLHLPLSTEAMARFEVRTEGWAAGLRLVALALEGRQDESNAEELLATFTGEDRQVLDYLTGEVLAGQSEAIQEFLLRTSFLNRLTGSLCDELTGRSDSALLLEQLARSNLFLIPLGDEGDERWYRYHTLFGEAMHHQARQRLGEAELQALYDKAAAWHQAHGFLADAVEALSAAHEFERAAALIEQILEQRGCEELHTLRRWVQQMPQDVLEYHAPLCFAYAVALLFTSDRYAPTIATQVEVPLRAAERVWRHEKNAPKLGQVQALRGLVTLWQGDFERSVAYAHESLELLSEDDVMWRGVSLLNVAVEALSEGRINAAQPLTIEARALCEAAQNLHGTLAAMHNLGEVCYWQGDFGQASQYYQHILAQAIGGDEMLDDQANAMIGLGTIALEQNEINSAEGYASQALEFATRRGNEFSLMQATVVLARVQQARGQMSPAAERLQSLAARIRQPPIHREIQSWQARLALARGDPVSVEPWYASLAAHSGRIPRRGQEQEALIAARMHMADEEPEVALELLESWRIDAHKNGRTLSELEILTLEALAYFAQSDVDRARKTLVRALSMAQPRGCQRVFLDEGEAMAALLEAVVPKLDKRPIAMFATLLMRAFASAHSTQPTSRQPTSSPLLEPLSPQEQRVLRLLAAGLSNPEIASELVVSTNTIKTQLQSIYRKLNVNNREDASDIARQLNLI
jgi:LuxR family maltose regulon positive regulatory protein